MPWEDSIFHYLILKSDALSQFVQVMLNAAEHRIF